MRLHRVAKLVILHNLSTQRGHQRSWRTWGILLYATVEDSANGQGLRDITYSLFTSV